MHNDNKVLLKLIGRRIGNSRRFRNLSQSDLADMSGKMVNTISNIERGLFDVKITTLNDISKALKLPIVELVVNENPVIRDENKELYRSTLRVIRKLSPEDMQKMQDIMKLFLKHSKHTEHVDY